MKLSALYGTEMRSSSATATGFVTFELEGMVHNNTFYLAMALSDDRKMGDDSSVACKLHDQVSSNVYECTLP